MKMSMQLGLLHHNFKSFTIEGKECEQESDARKSLIEAIDRHIKICKSNLRVLEEAREKVVGK